MAVGPGQCLGLRSKRNHQMKCKLMRTVHWILHKVGSEVQVRTGRYSKEGKLNTGRMVIEMCQNLPDTY